MIIGLLGKSRSGKDTAGAVLARELNGTCIAFADPIKRFCIKALGLTIEQMWGDDKEKPISKKQLKALEPKKPKDRAQLVFRVPMPTPWNDALRDACCRPVAHSDASAEKKLQAWWDSIKLEKDLTPRRVMQHFGTEYVRQNLSPTFWIHIANEVSDKLLSGQFSYTKYGGLLPLSKIFSANNDAVIITDVRFRNEVLGLKARGAKVYRVHRSGLKTSSTIDTKHASEAEQNSIPSAWLDGQFSNCEGRRSEFEESVKGFALNLRYNGTKSVA